jgi:hypothetical protein
MHAGSCRRHAHLRWEHGHPDASPAYRITPTCLPGPSCPTNGGHPNGGLRQRKQGPGAARPGGGGEAGGNAPSASRVLRVVNPERGPGAEPQGACPLAPPREAGEAPGHLVPLGYKGSRRRDGRKARSATTEGEHSSLNQQATPAVGQLRWPPHPAWGGAPPPPTRRSPTRRGAARHATSQGFALPVRHTQACGPKRSVAAGLRAGIAPHSAGVPPGRCATAPQAPQCVLRP